MEELCTGAPRVFWRYGSCLMLLFHNCSINVAEGRRGYTAAQALTVALHEHNYAGVNTLSAPTVLEEVPRQSTR